MTRAHVAETSYNQFMIDFAKLLLTVYMPTYVLQSLDPLSGSPWILILSVVLQLLKFR